MSAHYYQRLVIIPLLMLRGFRVNRYQHYTGGKHSNSKLAMLRGFRVSRCQHMAKTHTTFNIVDRSTILDFTLHLIAAVYAERLTGEYQRPKV